VNKKSVFKVVVVISIFILVSLFNINNLYCNKEYSDYMVCIDPGHPSETSDGRWKGSGITELEMNWIIALKLEKYLNEKYKIKTVMTKKTMDQLVTNKRRAEIANENNATLFLRLHCDSGGGRGFTLYYPDRQGKRYGTTGPSFKVIKMSKVAAINFQKGMARVLKGHLRANSIKGDSKTYIGGKQGALTGSIFCGVSSIVVEMVYLNNKSDGKFIKSEKGGKLMVRALTAGITEYFDHLNSKKLKIENGKLKINAGRKATTKSTKKTGKEEIRKVMKKR